MTLSKKIIWPYIQYFFSIHKSEKILLNFAQIFTYFEYFLVMMTFGKNNLPPFSVDQSTLLLITQFQSLSMPPSVFIQSMRVTGANLSRLWSFSRAECLGKIVQNMAGIIQNFLIHMK